MKFKFEKLIIWQKAMDFAEELNLLADSFPKRETYNLSSQMMRAVDSIALNKSNEYIHMINKI
jgi:four helix bundle protein